MEQSASIIMPFHPGLRSPAHAMQLFYSTIEVLRDVGRYNLYVVEDGIRVLSKSPSYQLISTHANMGKIAATRIGIAAALELEDSEAFVVADFDDEQDQRSIPNLLEAIGSGGLDAVIGNRYGFAAVETMSEHRILVERVHSWIGSTFGYDVADLPSGLNACNRTFAERFIIATRSARSALGFDWLILAYLANLKIGSIPIKARMRAESTDADKLAMCLSIVLNYENELISRGHDRLVMSCQKCVEEISLRKSRIRLPVDLIGGDQEVTLVRRDSNYVYVADST